jgi:hypothetical protein
VNPLRVYLRPDRKPALQRWMHLHRGRAPPLVPVR